LSFSPRSILDFAAKRRSWFNWRVLKMKTIMFAVAGVAAISTAGIAQVADKVTLQLKCVTQAQFAGFYVAKDKGFYKEEGLAT